MGSFGDYAKQTFQNGVTPVNPTTFQPGENKIEDIDNELAYSANFRFDSLKQYFWMRNCKEIHMFDDSAAWAASGCTLSEFNLPITGNDDVQFNDSNDVASTIYIDDTITALDLEKFNDASASSTDDIIAFSTIVYTFDFFDSITVILGASAAHYWTYTFVPAESNQVTFQAKKSAFAVGAGAPSWANIAYVRISVVTKANASTKYIVPLALMMYRNDPVTDGQGQPFQIYSGSSWSNFFTQSTALWNLIFDPAKNDLGIICLNDYNLSSIWNGLKVKTGVVSFVWKSVYHTYFYYTNNMTWYVNANNYITTWIDNDVFTLDICEAGVVASHTFNLTNTLIKELLTVKLEKNGQSVRAILIKGNDRIAVLEHLTTISATSSGDLYYGYDAQGLSFITDFMISNINNMDLDVWDKPKLVIKKEDESATNDDTISNDSELYCYLPPNSFFEIKLSLGVDCGSNTPDIKVDWAYSGISLVTHRTTRGPASNITSVAGAEQMRSVVFNNLDQDVVYGLDSDGTSYCNEKYNVSTGVNGGYVKLRWAQNTSDANAITVKAGSYIKITKCDLLQNN